MKSHGSTRRNRVRFCKAVPAPTSQSASTVYTSYSVNGICPGQPSSKRKAHAMTKNNQVRVLEDALRLAQQAGRERDAIRREALISECLQLWRSAQQMKACAPQAVAQYDREARHDSGNIMQT